MSSRPNGRWPRPVVRYVGSKGRAEKEEYQKVGDLASRRVEGRRTPLAWTESLVNDNYFGRFAPTTLAARCPVSLSFVIVAPALQWSDSLADRTPVYDRVMHDPVYRRGRRHRIGEDLLPLREDQVGRDAQ